MHISVINKATPTRFKSPELEKVEHIRQCLMFYYTSTAPATAVEGADGHGLRAFAGN